MKQLLPSHRPYLTHAVAVAVMALALAGCDGDNSVPVANAGLSQSVTTGATVTFDGSGSTDANGDPLTFTWTLVSKPEGSTATIMGANTAKPTFTPDLPGTYVASVVVSDGSMVSNSATVTVTASDVVGFNSLITPMPANYPSWGFDAYRIRSIGDHIMLKAGSPNTLAGFVVGMSTLSCQTGTWQSGCSSTPGATFKHPMTVKFYSATGTLLATKTQTFDMPYRPSVDPTCVPAGYWRRPDGVCAGSMAFHVKFDLRSLKASVPNSFYYELSMNTNSGGPEPIGVVGPYDTINVGVYDTATNPPTVGTDPMPGSVRWDGVEEADTNALQSQVILAAP